MPGFDYLVRAPRIYGAALPFDATSHLPFPCRFNFFVRFCYLCRLVFSPTQLPPFRSVFPPPSQPRRLVKQLASVLSPPKPRLGRLPVPSRPPVESCPLDAAFLLQRVVTLPTRFTSCESPAWSYFLVPRFPGRAEDQDISVLSQPSLYH